MATDYAGNYIYENNQLQFFSTPEGYVTPNTLGGYDYIYQYKDHLGNVRLSYTEDPSNPGQPTIIEENNYYPFGLKHKGYNTGGDTSLGNDVAQRWKFGGKELDQSLGLETYDFGARNYDPALGRWMNLDPLAETMRRHSPYNYAFNNPLRFIDPDGMAPFDLIVTGDIAAFKEQVSQSTGGFYNAVVDSNGNVTLEKSGLEQEGDGMFEMSDEQKAFTSEIQNVIDSDVVTEVESVSSDATVDVGSIVDNKIDMADVDEFDKAGDGASSSAAVLTHELVEQQEKAKAGGVKGTYPTGAGAMHKAGIDAENRVNKSTRRENSATGVNAFYKDGTIYTQVVTPQPSGTVKVTKTKIR